MAEIQVSQPIKRLLKLSGLMTGCEQNGEYESYSAMPVAEAKKRTKGNKNISTFFNMILNMKMFLESVCCPLLNKSDVCIDPNVPDEDMSIENYNPMSIEVQTVLDYYFFENGDYYKKWMCHIRETVVPSYFKQFVIYQYYRQLIRAKCYLAAVTPNISKESREPIMINRMDNLADAVNLKIPCIANRFTLLDYKSSQRVRFPDFFTGNTAYPIFEYSPSRAFTTTRPKLYTTVLEALDMYTEHKKVKIDIDYARCHKKAYKVNFSRGCLCITVSLEDAVRYNEICPYVSGDKEDDFWCVQSDVLYSMRNFMYRSKELGIGDSLDTIMINNNDFRGFEYAKKHFPDQYTELSSDEPNAKKQRILEDEAAESPDV